MRAMLLEFPDDPACAYLDRQYLLGDSLLVAPVFAADGVVDYYVPAGRWTHFLTGETVVGPQLGTRNTRFPERPSAHPSQFPDSGRRSERTGRTTITVKMSPFTSMPWKKGGKPSPSFPHLADRAR